MTRTLLSEGIKRRRVIAFSQGAWNERHLRKVRFESSYIYLMRLILPPSSVREIRHLTNFFFELPQTIYKLQNLIKREDVRVIGLQMLVPDHFYFWLIKILGGPRYIISLRGSDVTRFDQWPIHLRWLMKLTLKQASLVTANSRWLANEAKKVWPSILKSKNIIVIHNGLSHGGVTEFVPEDSPITEPKHTNITSPYYICVSSFDFYKGHDVLIDAWAIFVRSYPTWKLVLVGDGETLSDILAKARQLGISDNIIFLGQLSNKDTIALIGNSYALILPSRSEGFGNVIVEAALEFTPAIASKVGGVPEILDHMVTGLLVEPENPQALAKEMLVLSKKKDLRNSLGKAAELRARNYFSATRMADDYFEAINLVER